MSPKELKQLCLEKHMPQLGVKNRLVDQLLTRQCPELNLQKVDTLSLLDQKLAKFMEKDCGRIATVEQYEEALEQFGGEEKAKLAMAREEGGVCATPHLTLRKYREISSWPNRATGPAGSVRIRRPANTQNEFGPISSRLPFKIRAL